MSSTLIYIDIGKSAKTSIIAIIALRLLRLLSLIAIIALRLLRLLSLIAIIALRSFVTNRAYRYRICIVSKGMEVLRYAQESGAGF